MSNPCARGSEECLGTSLSNIVTTEQVFSSISATISKATEIETASILNSTFMTSEF